MTLHHPARTACVLAALLALAAPATHAQTGFGAAVAAADGVLYVAEPNNIVRSGIVYAYEQTEAGSWAELARITALDARAGDRFGSAIAAHGATLLVGQPGANGGHGVVHVYERRGREWRHAATVGSSAPAADDSLGRSLAIEGDAAVIGAASSAYVFQRSGGRWTQVARLTGSDAAAGDRYGTSVAIRGERVLVGAPGQAENRGAAYLYTRGTDGAWSETARLVSRTVSAGSLLGSAVALLPSHAVVGAPGRDEGTGAVYLFEPNPQQGGWAAFTRLFPWDGASGSQFGVALGTSGDELWVASPGADGFRGTIYRFARDEAASEWMRSHKLSMPADAPPGGFAMRFAVTSGYGIAAIPGANQGEGAVAFLGRDAGGAWAVQGTLDAIAEVFPAVTGNPVECSAGRAGLFECGGDVQLLSFLPIPDIGGTPGVNLNDIWGWTDPQTGREYALVGRTNGTSFVDVTDPANPRYVGDLPMTAGAQANAWRDIKVYRDHAYIVADGAGQHGMQVFDLTRLRAVGAPQSFTADTTYDRIASAHNIVINEQSGYAFAVGSNSGGEVCGGGLHMIDIREPKQPRFAGCFADPSTGNAGTGYSHDAQCVTYSGPDATYRGREICFGSNETALSIADVTDKDSTVAVARASYPNVQYAHQGWLTDDQRYFYMNDEGDEAAGVTERTRTVIWDVSDLDDPQFVGEYLGETAAIDHNLYVRGDTMYESNYASGLRIIDISNRTQPREIGHFDSVPNSPNTPAFIGSWSNYPYFESGTIVFTSIREGLFVVRVRRPIS